MGQISCQLIKVRKREGEKETRATNKKKEKEENWIDSSLSLSLSRFRAIKHDVVSPELNFNEVQT